jgi:parvulin-like peptidyl-prolyl isomerase
MGRFQLETKPEEIKRAISQLRPGEVSEAVRTPSGYTIIKLERRIGGLKSFDEVRGMIRQRLFKEKEKAPLDALKNRLRSRAEIQIFLSYEAESP